MSFQDYQSAVAIIENNRSLGFFAGPRSAELVQAAEQALGVIFPPTYRQFVSAYGAGNFGAAEIYGVTNANFVNASVPNGIWVTLRNRTKVSLPTNIIIIGDTGDGDYYCLETKGQNAEAPVIVYQPGVAPEKQRREEVAEDFGRFLLDRVQAEL